MHRSVPIALAIVALLVLPAAVAAASPHLSATVDPGHAIHLSGTGFPASAQVSLEITRNGARGGTRAVRSDANGAFSATIPAGPGLGGHYVFVATSGSVSATADVVAVETAGGGTRPSGVPTAPATSTDAAGAAGGSGGGVLPALLALVLAGTAALAGTLLFRRLRLAA